MIFIILTIIINKVRNDGKYVKKLILYLYNVIVYLVIIKLRQI